MAMPTIDTRRMLQDAIAHHRAGDLARAEALYRTILAAEPRNGDALHLLGVIAFQCQHHDAAIHLIRQALSVQGNNPMSYNDLGNALRATGRFDDAVDSYRAALALRPDYAEAYCNLGLAFRMAGRLQEALANHERAVALRPDLAEAQSNLGIVLNALGRLNDAIASFRRAIALRPDLAEAHDNLGTALHEKGLLDDAVACYRRALDLRPGFASAHNNLGNALNDQGRIEEAVRCYRQAIAVAPDFPLAHDNLGLALLSLGELPEGWREREWRWERNDLDTPRRTFARPRWDGGDLRGKTIFLHAEQGLGDTIHFIRYLPLVADRGARVIVACQPELRALLSANFPLHTFVNDVPAVGDYDCHCPLMSLPVVLGTTLDTIPGRVPYLRAGAGSTDPFRNRVGSGAGLLKVGLVWAGSKSHRRDRHRSIPFEDLAPLGRVPGIAFYSLQKGERAADPANAPNGVELTDLSGELRDMSDTAALVECLDLVISADTAVAHLAGAMGKPVWTMLPFAADWRWLSTGETTRWYPTMRLFRQTRPGDWPDVLRRVASALSTHGRV